MQIVEHRPKRMLISLTSLIDVVFILLIFFMLASSFMKWQFFELAIGESEPLVLNSDEQSLVRIEGEGRYLLNDAEMALPAIVAQVQRRIRSNAAHPVLVQPVGDLPLQQLTIVLEALDDVAKKNVSITRDHR